MFQQQAEQRAHRSFRGAPLGVHHLKGASAESRPFVVIFEQLENRRRQRLWRNDSQSVGLAKDFDDVTKVFRVRTNQNGRSKLRGLQNVVSAARYQAAAE